MKTAIRAAALVLAGSVVATSATADDGEGKNFYLSVDAGEVTSRMFMSNDTGNAGDPLTVRTESDSDLIKLRAGYHIAEGLSVELNFGQGDEGDDPGAVTVDQVLGIYVVPTLPELFGFIDLQFPMGYGEAEFDNIDESAGGASYGMVMNLRAGKLLDALEFLRVTGGYQVYYEDGGEKLDGFHAGLRFDF